MILRPGGRAMVILATMAVCLAMAACSKQASEQAEKKPMTKAQLDSAIAGSRLPGANVVGKALEVADSARVRANRPIPDIR